MGGQHNYCGLWLDQEYGNGHTSESCTTFKGYMQMSHSKEFQYRHLEVWGVGQPPVAPEVNNNNRKISVYRFTQIHILFSFILI